MSRTAELESRLGEIQARMKEIDGQYGAEALPEAERAEFQDLRKEKKENLRLQAELKAREEWVAEGAQDPERQEEGVSFQSNRPGVARGDDIYDLSTVRVSFTNPAEAGKELRERAMKSVESARFLHPLVSDEDAKTKVERLMQRDTEDGRFSRYLLATGAPAYKRAFPKLLVPNGAALLTRDEQASVNNVMMAERALNLTGAQGGFAVPFELDTTILNTSNGVVNPIRRLARVKQVTVDEWRGISSAGVTASYAAEATETTDNAPTLVQPTVSTEKAQAFIPFSIEVGMDWSGLQEAMSELIQDAKDTLEAGKFITGTGTNEPFGVAVGTTTTVTAGAGGTFTLANLYSLIQALPPRYRANASWIGDLIILNSIRRFDTVGSSAAIWQDSLQLDLPGMLLGKPAYEASEMPDVTTVGVKFLIVGDFSRYLIADRIGLTVDLIPHLMGANRRPTGERGIYAYWRNGAKVLDANAFRALLGAA